MTQHYIEVSDNKIVNYEKFLKILLKKWKVILILTVAGFAIAYVYANSIVPLYKISTSLLIRNQNEEISQTSNFFTGFSSFATNSNFYNEMSVVNSYPIVYNALTNLNFEVSYFEQENFSFSELFQNSPFVVVFNQGVPQPTNVRFNISVIGDNEYILTVKDKEVSIYSFQENKVIDNLDRLDVKREAVFGEEISTEYFRFKIIKNSNYSFSDLRKRKFFFVFSNIQGLADYYKNRVSVSQYNEQSTNAVIELLTANPAKGIVFLNSLANEFMKDNLIKKNYMANATIDYVNGQLTEISDSLKLVEQELQNFRRNNEVINLSTKAEQLYTQLQDLETSEAELRIRHRYYLYIKDHFDSNDSISELIAPSSMGIEDPLLGTLIQEFIQLNSEKTTLIRNNQERSPYLKNLDIKMDNLRNTIYENINMHISTIEINIEEIDQRHRSLSAELAKLPETEIKLLGIERDFNLTDEIYTFLMQRRAEAQIMRASNLPNIEVIEPPRLMDNSPVLPKKKIMYILGMFIGFTVPSLFYILLEIYKNAIYSEDEIKRITNIPQLGFILHKHKTDRSNVVLTKPKEPIVESFRKILVSLNYFTKNASHSTILVTSSISGEGKSFCAYNLGSVYALNKRKTIILGYDLRNPDFYEDLKISCEKGISTVLTNQDPLEEAIQKTSNEYLDVITPGPVPPNPSELIASEDTIKLINGLKQKYEIIVIDTPPIGILIDAFHLFELSDVKIFVVRLNYTPRDVFISTLQDLETKKIKKLSLLINDYLKIGHGYGYYYHNYTSKKSKSIIKNFKI